MGAEDLDRPIHPCLDVVRLDAGDDSDDIRAPRAPDIPETHDATPERVTAIAMPMATERW